MTQTEASHKKKLIDKIKLVDDKNVIDELYRLLEVDVDSSVYLTIAEQKREISIGQEQILAGKGIASKEADREIDEWLSK